MRKPSSEQISKFLLFAIPSYWLLAVLFIVLAIWKVGFNEPDLIPVALVSIAILAAAGFLAKNRYWICFPMILLGGYISFAMRNDQHVGHIVKLYGAYLVLHYSACLIYVLRKRGRGEGGSLAAVLGATIIFACAILLVGCSSTLQKEEEVLWDAKPSVMIDSILYGTTGRNGVYSTDTTPENGGHVDGEITSSVESHEYPVEDNQSNFGIGYPYRYGEDNTIEVFFDSANKWIIYEAYETQ